MLKLWHKLMCFLDRHEFESKQYHCPDTWDLDVWLECKHCGKVSKYNRIKGVPMRRHGILRSGPSLTRLQLAESIIRTPKIEANKIEA